MPERDCYITNVSVSYQAYKSEDVNQDYCVLPETLMILADNDRYIFLGVFIFVSVMSLVGNCAAIYSIKKRKYRYVQKTCIVSLAISDILSTIVIALNNIETFSHHLMIWTLGSFLCSTIPMCQMLGITASSTALMFIAMDRYRNVVHALSKRWNPSRQTCILITLALWIIIFGISYPMYNFFEQQEVTLVYVNFLNFSTANYKFVDAAICVSFSKEEMRVYYIVMVIIIFLPLLIVFLWFYYNIASLVWKHRKPLSTMCNNNETSGGLENSTSVSEVRIKNVKNLVKGRDLRVERKIRTFKIIVTLMIVFIICRLPYYTIFILKLSLSDSDQMWIWYCNYAFIALHIVNCCLNPLLYTFLNPTLTIWIKTKRAVKDFTWEIFCFCFSRGEFDEFEKENPFVVDNYNYNRSGRNSKVKFEENVQEIEVKY